MPISVILGVILFILIFFICLLAKYEFKDKEVGNYFFKIILAGMTAIGIQIFFGFILGLVGAIMGIFALLLALVWYIALSPLIHILDIPLLF